MVLGVLEGSPMLVKDPLDQNHLLKVTPENVCEVSLLYLGKRRAPRGPEVREGPRVPLGQVDVHVFCEERAPRGPPVGAGP